MLYFMVYRELIAFSSFVQYITLMPILPHTIVEAAFRYLLNFVHWEQFDNGNLKVKLKYPRPLLSSVRRYIRGIRSHGLQTKLCDRFTAAGVNIRISNYDVDSPRVVDRPVPQLDDRDVDRDPPAHPIHVAGAKF